MSSFLSDLPPWFVMGVVGIFGALVGSFLNVVIYRVPKRESIVRPGSRCPACAAAIAWYDNLPIVSWLLLRARCRKCKAPISIRYPLVEALTSALFLAVWWKFGAHPHTFVYLAFVATMVVLTFIDIDHRIIPDRISLPGIVIGVVLSFVIPQVPGAMLPAGWRASLLGVLLGGGVLFAVGEIYYRVRGQEGMGMGDVKMLGMIGAFLGAPALLFVIFCSALAGSLIGILLMVFAGGTRKTAIPFGPYLAMGAVAYLFVGPEVMAVYLRHSLPPAS